MQHAFRFFRAGGFNQVVLDSGDDLLHLDQLDQKLWVALACPTQGLVFDAATLRLIDSDGDGRIRANELIAAVQWAGGLLRDPGLLVQAPDTLELAAIRDDVADGAAIVQAARTVLQGLGKGDAGSISVADTIAALKAFNAMPFNGDGVVTVAAAGSDELKALINDVITTCGGDEDRSGAQGVTRDKVAQFFAAVQAFLVWHDAASGDADLQGDPQAALAALQAVRAKIDDFFVRAQLAEFDPRATAALNCQDKDFASLAASDLDLANADVRRLPLAAIDASAQLPLKAGLNPAWQAAMAGFVATVVQPLLGDIDRLTLAQWESVKSRLAVFEARQAAG